jgi:hypothetical protein
LPEANHEWTQIRLQNFKSIEDYNHVIHKVCAKLRFCEKEPSEKDKIEKTLQIILSSDWVRDLYDLGGSFILKPSDK